MKTPIELRVKFLSLSAEQKIIRRLELRILRARRRAVILKKAIPPGMDDDRFRLWHHRTAIVRKAARTAHLARMFLRDTPYLKVEYTCHEKPNWDAVCKLAQRYSEEDSRVLSQRFEQWAREPATSAFSDSRGSLGRAGGESPTVVVRPGGAGTKPSAS